MDNKNTFAIGETVRANSGGPVMHVSGTFKHMTDVTCQWFSGDKLERGLFPAESLIRVVPSDAAEKQQAAALINTQPHGEHSWMA